jgi:hypothetical protein
MKNGNETLSFIFLEHGMTKKFKSREREIHIYGSHSCGVTIEAKQHGE